MLKKKTTRWNFLQRLSIKVSNISIKNNCSNDSHQAGVHKQTWILLFSLVTNEKKTINK